MQFIIQPRRIIINPLGGVTYFFIRIAGILDTISWHEYNKCRINLQADIAEKKRDFLEDGYHFLLTDQPDLYVFCVERSR